MGLVFKYSIVPEIVLVQRVITLVKSDINPLLVKQANMRFWFASNSDWGVSALLSLFTLVENIMLSRVLLVVVITPPLTNLLNLIKYSINKLLS